MKGSFSNYLKKLISRLLSVTASVLTAVTLVSCSDVTRTPPDDDDGSIYEKVSCQSLSGSNGQSADFRACVTEVVQALELSDLDRAVLSSCDFESAQAQEASAEQFESARSLIRENCL